MINKALILMSIGIRELLATEKFQEALKMLFHEEHPDRLPERMFKEGYHPLRVILSREDVQ